jgi:hypothetical protein
MTGVITKKHFLEVAKTFGWRKAIKLLFSSETAALRVLMEG